MEAVSYASNRLVLVAAAVGCVSLPAAYAEEGSDPAGAVFARRIKPIFASPNPSSCIECHLAGVDLKNYIKSSSEKTFLSLRDQGLIDLDRPERSRILALISMAEASSGPSLISSSVRASEYDAFAEWIKAASADSRLRSAPRLSRSEPAAPARSAAVIRHTRRDRVLASFERRVWSQRFRCASCHAPEGAEVKRLVEKEGTDDFLWLRPEGPAATMRHLVSADLIDTKRPEESELLTKPTAQVKHGGGKKMEIGDLGYKELRRWIEDYARTVNDGYREARDLPKEDNRFYMGSDIWLKIANTPPQWGDKLLQVDVHARTSAGGWSREPVATSDRAVWGKGRLWQHALVLVSQREPPKLAISKQGEPGRLPPGSYLIRVFVDRTDKLSRDWRDRLSAEDQIGETVVDTTWDVGYGKMTVVDATKITSTPPP